VTDPSPIQPQPNVLRDAATPNVLWTTDPGGPPRGTGTGPSRATALPFIVLFLVVVAGVAGAPLLLSSVEMKDPCMVVDELIASGEPQAFDAPPQAWMPARVLPGYEVTLDRGLTLEMVAASRVNPEESRVELVRDKFIDGHEQDWEGATDGVGFTAQRFATVEGAEDFHAFANRFACQFANETFPGPRGSIGLQIRYRGGDVGEQVSWVSGTTRILVGFIQDDAPPDHSKILALAALVPHG
jgi:hypothetical protein